MVLRPFIVLYDEFLNLRWMRTYEFECKDDMVQASSDPFNDFQPDDQKDSFVPPPTSSAPRSSSQNSSSSSS